MFSDANYIFFCEFRVFKPHFLKIQENFLIFLRFMNSARSKTYPWDRSGPRNSFFLKSIFDHFQWFSRNRTWPVPRHTLVTPLYINNIIQYISDNKTSEFSKTRFEKLAFSWLAFFHLSQRRISILAKVNKSSANFITDF